LAGTERKENEMSTTEKRPPVVIELHVEAFSDERDETLEVERGEWDQMTPEQRSALASDAVDTMMSNYVSAGWNIADSDDMASTE
jgi:hypothetical protein